MLTQTQDRYVRIAEIEIDPDLLENYRVAAREVVEISVRVEAGVLALYSVAAKDDPSRVTVFEIYSGEDAYKAHLETPHFKKYKATTQNMVKALRLFDTVPIALAAK